MRNKANSKFISVCTCFCQMARISQFGEVLMCFYQKLLKNVTSASQIVKIWFFMWKATSLVTLAFGKNLSGISSWKANPFFSDQTLFSLEIFTLPIPGYIPKSISFRKIKYIPLRKILKYHHFFSKVKENFHSFKIWPLVILKLWSC